jgi:hypothetical protein
MLTRIRPIYLMYNFVHANAVRSYSWLQLSCHPPFCMLVDVLIFPVL